MKNNVFNFCPDCGSKNIQTKMNGRKWLCSDCGFDLYNNVAAAVGVIIVNEKNEVLFERRAKEPRKGFLALPGGFCDPMESAEEGALRECIEEIGIKPEKINYVCTNPNTYVYKDIEYKTCDIFFEAVLPEKYDLKFQESEVESIEWHKIESCDDIEKLPLAFESAVKSLKKWLEK